MWFLPRILRISWTEKVKNEEVLRRADVTKKLVQTIRKRQLSFLGHVYRKDDLERAVLTGRIEGKRDRGRQRLGVFGEFEHLGQQRSKEQVRVPESDRTTRRLEAHDRRYLLQSWHIGRKDLRTRAFGSQKESNYIKVWQSSSGQRSFIRNERFRLC